MGANLRQLAVQGPGSQGLNSELSPFQQSIEFALKADNCVIDRVGRLASREAFADYVSEHDFGMTVNEQFDVVRLVTSEPDNFMLKRDSNSEYSVGEYNTGVEYNGLAFTESQDIFTFCLIGIGPLDIGSIDYTEYGGSAYYNVDEYVGSAVTFTRFDRYVGAVIKDGKLEVVPSIQTNYGVTNAQLVPFMDEIYVFSKGDGVQVYAEGVGSRLSDHPNYLPPQDDNGIIADEIDGDIACAAYGRLWVSGVNGNYDTIYYSDLLAPHQWYDGKGTATDEQNTAGIIDVREYWPTGNDKIQGIAAHNGFLIIFGRHSILIYSGAQGDPAGATDAQGNFIQGSGLQLQDAIRDVGLVNQDAMCNIGSDHLFIDSLGVRSLGRVVQEKSVPIGEPSLNVASVIREEIDRSRDFVRLLHLSSKSKALCLFPNTRTAYCFQLGQPSATGGLRVTQWTGCDFWDSTTLRTDYSDRELLGGRDDRGVLAYEGYTQPIKYTMSYESSVLLSGESLMQSMIPKSLIFSYHSEQEHPFYARWGFGSNEMQYMAKSQRARGSTEFKTSKVNTAGSGEMLRVGFDCQIHGGQFAMQQISVNAVVGRVIV
jgi:hypothetical protein